MFIILNSAPTKLKKTEQKYLFSVYFIILYYLLSVHFLTV